MEIKQVNVKPIEWLDDKLRIIDQTRLPGEIIFLDLCDYEEVALAIKSLQIRGAPTIGIGAAYGIALGSLSIGTENRESFLGELNTVFDTIASTRPTAVNLFKAIERMRAVAYKPSAVSEIKTALVEEARRVQAGEEESTKRLSELGAQLIQNGFTILTHCNAGALATTGYGTALGVIRFAKEQGKRISVFADETRPLLQGARLTAWELMQENIPVTLITDSMAGHFMSQGGIDCVIVGADRIAANGDVANKIGTYTVAVLAKENGIPFYVAAPLSTLDLSLPSGSKITIEERDPSEVTHFADKPVAPKGVSVANPAFDVTPHRYVTAIITEEGVVREPYEVTLKGLFQ